MEERVLKIIEDQINYGFDLEDRQNTAKEITAHFKQFNLWCIKDAAMHFTGDFVACEHNKRFKTQEELYSFWENEINK